MTRMKPSKYNHVVTYDENCYLLYNVLTGGLLEVDAQDLEYLGNPSMLNESDDSYQTLVDNGFLVPEELDELTYVELENRKNCAQSAILSLTIAPTMRCMCACPYCYEIEDDSVMSETMQHALVETICHMVQEDGYKKVDVSWYGGEPLLAIGAIENMSRELIERSKTIGFDYQAFIITNGVLFTAAIVRRLNDCAIKAAQITIDGLESAHDSLRPLKNGMGTYRTILNNIESAADIAQFDINIRTNIGTDNAGEYMQLKAIIDSWGKPNVYMYAARRESYPNSSDDTYLTCMSQESFADFLKANDLFKFRRQRKAECYSCLAESLHSFAIDSRGFVYKCWNEVGETQKSFGQIDETSFSIRVLNSANALKYLVTHSLDDEECRECKVLPLCMGGCLYQKHSKGAKECIEERYCLDEYVLQAYTVQSNEERM